MNKIFILIDQKIDRNNCNKAEDGPSTICYIDDYTYVILCGHVWHITTGNVRAPTKKTGQY